MKTTAVVFVAVVFAGVWNESSSCPPSSSDTRPRPGWPSFQQLQNKYPTRSWDDLVAQEGLSFWLDDMSDKDTGAVRVSYALTHAGRPIGPLDFCNWSGAKNSQGRPYIIRAATMRCYLENVYGAADYTGSFEIDFRLERGIIVFQNCGSKTTEHVDLWDGSTCTGSCYFDDCSDIRLFKF